MIKKKQNDLVSNRKAYHNYEIIDTFEAGIVLTGTEIKSLRKHSGSLQDAYIIIIRSELWLIHSSIPPYTHGNIYNHKEKRERKLLMHKNEIIKLDRAIKEKGLALIPLSLYLKNGKVKVNVALAKGKKSFEKREKIKEREHKKEISSAMKHFHKDL